jgi:site-specific DNA recombinase
MTCALCGKHLDATPVGAPRWNAATIRNIAVNRSYTGKAAFGRTEVVESSKMLRPTRGVCGASKRGVFQRPRPEAQRISIDVPAIVSQELFDAAQEQLVLNRKLSARNWRSRRLLQGLTVCRLCKYTYYGVITHGSDAEGGAAYTCYR